MILVNTDYIAGQELEMLGLVKGSTIQSKNIGRDITQGFKTLVGGELGAYTDMMNDARALATKTSRLGEGRFVGALAPKQSGRELPPPGKSLLLSGGGGYTPAAVTISKKHAISGLIHLLL